jgi:putative transcriptional regulator
MSKRVKKNGSLPYSKRDVAKLTPLGRELLEGLDAVRDDLSGRKQLPERVVHVPDLVDVKAIRGRLKMSQNVFADFFGFDRAAVKNWEQGRRAPEKTARVLLTVIAHNPKVVREALTKGGSQRSKKSVRP